MPCYSDRCVVEIKTYWIEHRHSNNRQTEALWMVMAHDHCNATSAAIAALAIGNIIRSSFRKLHPYSPLIRSQRFS